MMGKRWIALISGIAILVIASIVLCAVPMIEVTYYESEPYTTTETYYESEPYTTTETYYESEPYTVTEIYYEKEPYTASVPVDYQVTGVWIYNWFWTIGSDCWVTIKNTDIKSGYFYVTFYLTTEGGATTTKHASEYIAIGEEKDVLVKHPGDYVETFTYSITPPEKEVTKYEDVEKRREVTKYRDVEKTREVTKYKDVKKTREVIEYKDVEKTKRVTALEYLMDYW